MLVVVCIDARRDAVTVASKGVAVVMVVNRRQHPTTNQVGDERDSGCPAIHETSSWRCQGNTKSASFYETIHLGFDCTPAAGVGDNPLFLTSRVLNKRQVG
jgi:hypothetical protein